MNREFRMILLKKLVNVPLWIVDKSIPEPQQVVFPQTQLLLRTYKRMLKVYERDCQQGYFDAKPDGNFERFLRVGWKVLSRLSEDDRYYRAWLGLAFVLAHDEILHSGYSAKELKSLIRYQWGINIEFLPDAYVNANREEFLEFVLTNCLSNAVDLREEDWR